MADFDEITKQLNEPDPEPETNVAEILGREVRVKALSETQLLQMQHEVFIFQSDQPAPRKQKSLDRIYRALNSVILDDGDKDFVEDAMADGTLHIRELVKIMFSFIQGSPAPAKVRRGRAPVRK